MWQTYYAWNEKVFHCILCHSFILGGSVLRSKVWSKKVLIFYKTNNGTSTMKNHVEFEHYDIVHMYFNKVTQEHSTLLELFERWGSKLRKVVNPTSKFHFANFWWYFIRQKMWKTTRIFALIIFCCLLWMSYSLWAWLKTYGWGNGYGALWWSSFKNFLF
jgi:hypothetical protein